MQRFSSLLPAVCLPGEHGWQDKLTLSDNTCLCHSSILLPYEVGTRTVGGSPVSSVFIKSRAPPRERGKINTVSAANLCIQRCCDAEHLICATPLARRPAQVPQGDSCFSEMGLFKYKYVYKGTSNDSLFLANKTLNTILNERMEISCVPFKNEEKRKAL